MFYGHYCGAWIIKVLKPEIPLWVLIVAVQFVDFLFSFFIILGIEEVRIVRGFTKCNDMNLVFIPYTHSLIAAIGWSIVFGLWYRFSGYGGGNRAAFLVGLAVLSHWVEDLLAHSKDLLLLTFDNNAPKYGFRLWDYPEIYLPFEFSLFYGSYYYYLANTEVDPSKLYSTQISNNDSNKQPSQNYWASKWGPIILFLDSLWSSIAGIFIPPPENSKLLGIIMLSLYFKMTYLSHQLDKVRSSKDEKSSKQK